MHRGRSNGALRAARSLVLISAAVVASFVASGPAAAQGREDSGFTKDGLGKAVAALQERKAIPADAVTNPEMRILATVTNVILADAQAYNEEHAAAQVDRLVALEDLTPDSALLDHCDRIAALADRADALGKRYPDYLSAAQKQGEIEVAAGGMAPGALRAFLEGMARQRPSFEKRWNLLSSYERDAAALCVVLARRHWQKDPAGTVQLEEQTDLDEASKLMERLEAEGTQLAALEEAARANTERKMRALPSK